MSVQWTEDQKKVIELRNRNILVSAAAGSGKTAVLVERIIQRLLDERDPLDVDRLLIVTFTEAAAAEMKERIRDAIENALEDTPGNVHLQRQATLIHSARITTIHSFCLSVIREHFHAINLDPGFRIAEEGELKLLRQDVLEEMLESVEGLQEEYYDRYLRLEQPPFSETDESDEAKRSRWVDMLLAGSTFVMPEKQADQSIVKEEDIEEAMKAYIAVMDPVLTSVQKPVARAIMATSLSILPVFFNSAEEIHNYIENSLGSCTDPFEKATCMELLQQIMEN